MFETKVALRLINRDYAQSTEEMVATNDTAAGGPWDYSSRAGTEPVVESLRDNFYSLFRISHHG